MLSFVIFLDNKLQGQSSAPDPWVFPIDVAPMSHCVCFSLCASQAHLPMPHQSRQHVRSTASGRWSDETRQGRAGHCMRQLVCDNTARHPPCKWKRRSLRQPCKEQEAHAFLGERSSSCIAEPGEKSTSTAGGTLWPMTPPRCWPDSSWQRAHFLRSGKRGPLPDRDLQSKAPHEIAISILTRGEEEHADEDDADAMLTREVQEEEGDEAD